MDLKRDRRGDQGHKVTPHRFKWQGQLGRIHLIVSLWPWHVMKRPCISHSGPSGIYALDVHANERWRAEIPAFLALQKRPRSDELLSLTFDEYLNVWSRGGGLVRLSKETGERIDESDLEIQDHIVQVFKGNGHLHVLQMATYGGILMKQNSWQKSENLSETQSGTKDGKSFLGQGTLLSTQ